MKKLAQISLLLILSVVFAGPAVADVAPLPDPADSTGLFFIVLGVVIIAAVVLYFVIKKRKK